MKIIVTFSGGKDSLAALLWVRNNMSKKFTTVFCDTGWESDLTYKYIDEIDKKLNLNIVTLKSKKYSGLVDLSEKKTRFPSSQRRFCTSELKSIPMIDYILDEVNDDFIVIQGIRGAESASRAAMNAQCNYFKYYLNPYKTDKNGKPKYHTYRRKEILRFCEAHATDVIRPVFEWSAQDVVDYILKNGLEPNPLYRMGMKRVGCFPCIMCGLSEIHQIATRFPERVTEIAEHEKRIGSSFFGPDKIPSRFYDSEYPLVNDVVRYAKNKYDAGQLFDDSTETTCMSYYGLCE
ncbi:phosphoadenosine phosphosulfate reductase domain-containing protein [Bacteroides heparinolyticus]|uniref:phosphoadenosine phosphosulfate reductase domain-containing protein n=1 Tax=Prevotella heparinolytica TaxID=28113 RepID=UPI0035A0D0D4